MPAVGCLGDAFHGAKRAQSTCVESHPDVANVTLGAAA